MKVFAVANQKGGVAKTTTVLNLGVCLAEREHRVLLIDLDPQANLSMGLGVDVYADQRTVYDVLLNAEMGASMAIQRTSIPGVDVIPSTLDLTAAEFELAGRYGREWLLREALEDVQGYDCVLVDTPPSLGLFMMNALTAATDVIIPLQVHVYALRAIPQLQRAIALVQKHNPGLQIFGIVCTMYDSRNNLSQEVVHSIRQMFGELVLETIVGINVKLAEAPAAGLPVTHYAPRSTGAEAYRALAEEVEVRWRQRELQRV